MHELKNKLPLESLTTSVNNSKPIVKTTCRWSPKRIEMETRVIVEALKRAEFRWVSRQERIGESASVEVDDSDEDCACEGRDLICRERLPKASIFAEICRATVKRKIASPHSKLEITKDAKCEAHKFYGMFKYNLHHLPQAFPESFKSCEIVEGDGGVGTIRHWKYILPGKTEVLSCHNRAKVLNDENMLIALDRSVRR